MRKCSRWDAACLFLVLSLDVFVFGGLLVASARAGHSSAKGLALSSIVFPLSSCSWCVLFLRVVNGVLPEATNFEELHVFFEKHAFSSQKTPNIFRRKAPKTVSVLICANCFVACGANVCAPNEQRLRYVSRKRLSALPNCALLDFGDIRFCARALASVNAGCGTPHTPSDRFRRRST